jgi:hypothetical protein
MSTTSRPWFFTPAEGDESCRSQPRLLTELGLDSLTVARILEWFALKIWVAGEEGSGEREYHGKSYDPLKIELDSGGGGVAHSYVFNLRDGGRHHGFQSLEELEIALTEELIGVVEWAGRWALEKAGDV